MICSTGDRPGEGTYKCYCCGSKVNLQDNEELPKCEGCGGTCFK